MSKKKTKKNVYKVFILKKKVANATKWNVLSVKKGNVNTRFNFTQISPYECKIGQIITIHCFVNVKLPNNPTPIYENNLNFRSVSNFERMKS